MYVKNPACAAIYILYNYILMYSPVEADGIVLIHQLEEFVSSSKGDGENIPRWDYWIFS